MNKNNISHPFNSAIECGLRSLIILEYAYPRSFDIQRLVFYDYLLVHSADASGPDSLHPATPHRSGEVLLKRQILDDGLMLMLSRNLIEKHFETTGIVYRASNSATSFLSLLSSNYVAQLKERAGWVVDRFQQMSDKELDGYFYSNLDRWGGEFEKEALMKYGTL